MIHVHALYGHARAFDGHFGSRAFSWSDVDAGGKVVAFHFQIAGKLLVCLG
jgi:hypothetical protein